MSLTGGSNYRVTKSTRRTSTCDLCKSRHQKCDGAQPKCSNCEQRGVICSYSHVRTHARGLANSKSPESSSSIHPNPRLHISNADYDRLYSQIFDNIVQRLNLEGGQKPRIDEQADTPSGSASLPSFHQDVSNLLREELRSSGRQNSSQVPDGKVSTPDQIKELTLERNLANVRKILRNSLPTQDVAQRLLDFFFDYQNTVFYVCNKHEAQKQLDLMYQNSGQTTVSWYCQMFLIFAVGAQFDDLDDGNGESYYLISQKNLDDAIEENPQNTVWVTRAMLLLCFFQPPTKWNSIWIYFDVAIRTAQKFQLDLGHNTSKEFSDEEYQEWRQLWLTLVSFDRWVAIFLGRMPRIQSNMSKDPIFKNPQFVSGLDSCVMQNHITSLAIISGHILRDLYFSEQHSPTVYQQRKHELETWTAALPHLLQHIELNMALDLPKDQLEATFNLHFMQMGTWMLLTRPSLLRAIKTSTLSVGSAVSSDARICIDFAFRLINSASTMLSESLPPKRSFMPLFFLVNAAHVMILGAIWNTKQNNAKYDSTESYDRSRELASIDAATRILDLCGQRNAFARKYSVLIKHLRQKLNKSMPDTTTRMMSLPSAPTQPVSLLLQPPLIFSSSESSSNSISTNASESQVYQNISGTMNSNSNTSTPSSQNENRHYYPPVASTDALIEPWSEHFGIFYPTNDFSPNDSSDLLKDAESDFMSRMW